MFSKFELAKKYIAYKLNALNGKGHGTHSPFVYNFIRKVLNDKETYPSFAAIEGLRNCLKKEDTELEIKDFGAGSRVDGNHHRKISNIAKAALKPAKFSQLFYRIINYYQYHQILELGTSLGITTSYLASADPQGKVFTMEGAPSVAKTANRNFEKLQLTNIQIIEGNFDDTLPVFLKQFPSQLDFIFIDGNHRKDPTIHYFNLLLPHIHDHSVIIFDDIHWSQDMEEAWNQIKADPRVKISIDLFFVGLVFFRNENLEKEDFTIRF
ncbi:O-methyltransferase [Rhizosphaericola mali]|uniref:Class I SAM-dependent methyltransferase n=1 Tax=Rhizosphaericola mali TaxID=2545455 RepID=A0A5P2FYV9_9BACT|nr:class I SAM-dependent methyltransferase [Rhizosphaericola mali]QES87568.1 class I SAM-dependent methyltransferase [Rhizosphaericola mali]